MALWTYTLLPMPDAGSYTCAGTQIHAFGFVGDILRARSEIGVFPDQIGPDVHREPVSDPVRDFSMIYV